MESFELTKILEELSSLHLDIIELAKNINQKTTKERSRSTELNELFSALAKAQAEMQIAGMTSNNPFFKSKYADLAEMVKASRPSLAKNNLSIIQQVLPNEDGQLLLHTILGHSSGQWIESRMRILPTKPDIQALGSYITYLRRYSYAAICGIVASDEDDDGEVAMMQSRYKEDKGTALNTKYDAKKESFETITKEQLEELEYELSQYPDITEMILEGMKIQSLADLPKTKFMASINRIRQIKDLRNNGK